MNLLRSRSFCQTTRTCPVSLRGRGLGSRRTACWTWCFRVRRFKRFWRYAQPSVFIYWLKEHVHNQKKKFKGKFDWSLLAWPQKMKVKANLITWRLSHNLCTLQCLNKSLLWKFKCSEHFMNSHHFFLIETFNGICVFRIAEIIYILSKTTETIALHFLHLWLNMLQ